MPKWQNNMQQQHSNPRATLHCLPLALAIKAGSVQGAELGQQENAELGCRQILFYFLLLSFSSSSLSLRKPMADEEA
ncbi:unnamed protein product [Prunus armeniaca]|uniref:Uncharacterized protein n=1 Tax=Prunus armeniaca TaxID=36596 RepID=A0A6J5VLN4_PRUAR|nr:unnamed protein product [Prunus armeniaca]